MVDQNGCILVIEGKVNHQIYVLPNIYNSNIESEQFPTLSQLITIWKILIISIAKHSSWWRF